MNGHLVSGRCTGRSAARRNRPRSWGMCAAILLVAWAITADDSSFRAVAEDSTFRTITDDPTAQDVRTLIDAFSSPDRAARTAAERALYELGPGALPHLPPAEQLPSPAAQDAVRRVREALQREKAEQSVGPSHVTQTGRFPLDDVLKQITSQTGNDIRAAHVASSDQPLLLSVDWEDRSFWDCLEDIERQTDLSVGFNPAADVFELVSDALPAHKPIASATAGAFRITVDSANVREDFTNPARSLLRLKYTVAAEPRLRPLFVRMAAADFAAVGDDVQFVPLNPDAKLERPVRDAGPVSLSADFVLPRSASPERVDITGRLTIELAAGQEPIVFRNLEAAEHVVRRRGGVTVTLERAEFTDAANGDASARLELRVAYDQGGPAFESHRTWVYHNEAYLRTAAQPADRERTRWSHSGFDTLAAEEGAVKLSYRFRDLPRNGEAFEFVYVAPTLLISVPVDIELLHVPVTGLSIER